MRKIALAEDHLQMRKSITSLINHLPDHSVFMEADNGIQLIEQLNTSKTLPSIAIIDVQMPKMDGVAITNYLGTHYPSINILVISCHCNPIIVLDMLCAGAKGYIFKSNLSSHTLLQAFSIMSMGSLFIDEELGPKEVFESALVISNGNNHPLYHEITEKEKLFLQLAATTASYDQIARLMHVADASIYNYQKSLKEKTGLSSRQEYMLYAIQHGIAKVARLNNSALSIKNHI